MRLRQADDNKSEDPDCFRLDKVLISNNKCNKPPTRSQYLILLIFCFTCHSELPNKHGFSIDSMPQYAIAETDGNKISSPKSGLPYLQ